MGRTYAEADRYFEAGKFEQALQRADQVPSDDDEWLDAQALAVECLSELGRFDEADRRAAEVLSRDPHWATGYWVRGLAALEAGKLDAAERFMGWAWDNDQTLAEAALFLSMLADFQGRYDAGDDWLVEAAKADETTSAPLHLDAATMDDVLLEVMDAFPDEALETLEESHVRVVPMPQRRDLAEGVGLSDYASVDFVDPDGEPPTFGLTVFQRNLERGAKDIGDVRDRLMAEFESALGQLFSG